MSSATIMVMRMCLARPCHVFAALAPAQSCCIESHCDCERVEAVAGQIQGIGGGIAEVVVLDGSFPRSPRLSPSLAARYNSHSSAKYCTYTIESAASIIGDEFKCGKHGAIHSRISGPSSDAHPGRRGSLRKALTYYIIDIYCAAVCPTV